MSEAPIDREQFLAFCLSLQIESKDRGIIQFRPSATQLFVLDEVIKGLEEGQHQFIMLKCRQARCSTICLALSLYWAFKHGGLYGKTIADNIERKIIFREIIKRFIQNVPDQWKQQIIKSNNDLISFGNRSLLLFGAANQRIKGGGTKGVGLSLVHATEVGWWTDQQSLSSLISSLSKINPNRLYLFESTANGPNLFKTMWDKAAKSVSTRPIFIGWWLHEDYEVTRESPAFKTYYETSPRLTGEEERWIGIVERRYGFKVRDTQVAWWRFTLAEEFLDDLELMYQEYPPYPEIAFQFSGSPFILKRALNERVAEAVESEKDAKYYRFEFGENFEDTRMVEAHPKWYDLVLWRAPIIQRGVIYLLGADPSHGGNEESDVAAVQLVRAYADRVEQVGEFARRGLPTYQLAWVILYLLGAYNSGPPMMNIELQGGGHEVVNEIQRVQNKRADSFKTDYSKHFANLQHYLYARSDAIFKSYTSLHTKTTGERRATTFQALRDYLERPLLITRSMALVRELAGLVRTPNGSVEPLHRKSFKDDLTMALGLALMSYLEMAKYRIGGTSFTWESFKAERELKDGGYSAADLIRDKVENWWVTQKRKES